MTYNETDDILVVKTAGIIEIESATLMRNEGASLLKQHGCLRCLLDHIDLEADALQTLDIYNLPKRYAALGISHAMRMAVVVPPQFRKNMKFFEAVCQNNAYLVSVFFDHDSALAWLKT